MVFDGECVLCHWWALFALRRSDPDALAVTHSGTESGKGASIRPKSSLAAGKKCITRSKYQLLGTVSECSMIPADLRTV
jgi:predicted DCC family thiol-disulfide oxidoreductase YuxK